MRKGKFCLLWKKPNVSGRQADSCGGWRCMSAVTCGGRSNMSDSQTRRPRVRPACVLGSDAGKSVNMWNPHNAPLMQYRSHGLLLCLHRILESNVSWGLEAMKTPSLCKAIFSIAYQNVKPVVETVHSISFHFTHTPELPAVDITKHMG